MWREASSQIMLQLLLLTFHLGACLLAAAAAADSKAVRYSLVIDSGSSGTRIYAYTWQAANQPGHLPLVTAVPPSQAAAKIPRKIKTGMYERVETQPGLSQYVKDLDGLHRHALRPLLEWARAVVPRSQWRCTPIFLLATAGMRKLDALQRATLLTAVQQYLAKSGFRFEPSWARIITGAEEGAFGWVAANYMSGGLSGVLGQPPALPAGANPVAMGKQYEGTLDLGGSSLEVTRLQGTVSASHSPDAQLHSQTASALPTGTQPMHSRHIPKSVSGSMSVGMQETDLVVGGVTYQLLTTTYRRYGLSDTFDRSVSLLLQELHDRSTMLSLAIGGHAFKEPVPRPSTLASEPGALPLSAPPPTQVADHLSPQQHFTGDGADVAVSALPNRQQAKLQQASEQGGGWDVDSAVQQQQVMVSARTPETHGAITTQASSGSSTGVDQTSSTRPSSINQQEPHSSQTAPLHYHDGDGGGAVPHRRVLGVGPEAATQAAVLRVSQRVQQVQQSRAAHYSQQQQQRSSAAAPEHELHPQQQEGMLLPQQQQQQTVQQTGTPQQAAELLLDGIREDEEEEDAWLDLQLAMMPQDHKHAALCGTIKQAQHLVGSQSWAMALLGSHIQQAVALWVQRVLQSVQHALQLLCGQVQIQARPRSRTLLQVESPPSSLGHDAPEQAAPLLHRDTKHVLVIDHVAQPPGSQSSKAVTTFQADLDSKPHSSSSSSNALRGGHIGGQQAAHNMQDAGLGIQKGGGNASVPDTFDIQQLEHPCLPKGYDAPYSRLHDYGISIHQRTVRLLGTGMASECQALANTLVKHSLLLPTCSPTTPSSTLSVSAPQPVFLSHEQAFSAMNQPGVLQVDAPSAYQSDGSRSVTGHTSARSTAQGHGLVECDQGVAATQLQGRVMALTGFYVVWRFFLGAAGAAGHVQEMTTGDAKREVLLQAVQDLCEKPWSYHSSNLGQHVNVEKYCLWGRYASALLGPHGMNLSQSQVTIGSGDVGWPLGAALAEASREAPDLLQHMAAAHSTQPKSWWSRLFNWQSQQVIAGGCGYTVVVQDHVRTLRSLTAGVVLLVCVLGILAWWGPQLCRRVNRGLLRPWLGIGAVRHSASERKLHAPPLLPMSRPIRNRSHSNLLSRYLSPGS